MRARAALFTIVALGALALPVVPAGAGAFCSRHVPLTDARDTTVEMKGNCFGPTVARIETGDTVTFLNSDPTVHSVAGVNGTFGDPHSEIRSGEEVSFSFNREGVFPYVCTFHPGMAGAIVVGGGAGKVSSAAGIASSAVGDRARPDRSGPISESSDDGSPIGLLALAAALAVGSVAAFVRFRARPATAPAQGAAIPRR
jgi:plastocyanin